MIAQLLAVDYNAKKKSKAGKDIEGVSFKIQAVPFQGRQKEPADKFVFTNSPIVEQLKQFKAGDWIEIKFDETPYKNPISVTAANPPIQAAPKEDAPKAAGGFYPRNDTETQLRIARSVAFKGAADLVIAMFNAGAYPKTKIKPELLVQDIKAISKDFEGYLNMTEDVAAIAADVSSVEVTEDFDQEVF
jgi:hypothetical protein